MLKKCIFLICMVSLFTQPSWGEDYSFRNSRWGMTEKDVTASEKTMVPVEINDNTIKYQIQLLENNVELNYLFTQNKLIGSSYKLNDNYLNSIHFLSTYKRFKEALTRKYGRPKEDRTNWLNDKFRYASHKKGLALSLGHTEYFANWETAISRINIRMKEENYYVICLIEFWSKEHPYLAGEINEDDFKKEDIIDPF